MPENEENWRFAEEVDDDCDRCAAGGDPRGPDVLSLALRTRRAKNPDEVDVLQRLMDQCGYCDTHGRQPYDQVGIKYSCLFRVKD